MNPARIKPAFQPLRGNTARALELAIARFERRLRYVARLIAEGDKEHAKDLYEVAITELWELDPARFDTDDDGYLWQAMTRRMFTAHRDHLRNNPIRPPVALRLR